MRQRFFIHKHDRIKDQTTDQKDVVFNNKPSLLKRAPLFKTAHLSNDGRVWYKIYNEPLLRISAPPLAPNRTLFIFRRTAVNDPKVALLRRKTTSKKITCSPSQLTKLTYAPPGRWIIHTLLALAVCEVPFLVQCL